jgi:hypothetical protein
MKHKMLIALGLIVFGMVLFSAIPAMAMNGNGSYYATPSWDQTLSSYARFFVLMNMNSEAVLDKETGLVWEQSSSTDTKNWIDAHSHCNALKKGNRMGWRLPTLQELESLVDPSRSNPALPNGHPFSNALSSGYWSSTTGASGPASAWNVHFSDGYVGYDGKGHGMYVRCVRGGQGVDPQ